MLNNHGFSCDDIIAWLSVTVHQCTYLTMRSSHVEWCVSNEILSINVCSKSNQKVSVLRVSILGGLFENLTILLNFSSYWGTSLSFYTCCCTYTSGPALHTPAFTLMLHFTNVLASYALICEAYMVQFGPSSLILNAKLCSVAQQGDASARVISHDSRVVERSQPFPITIIRTCTK